MSPDSGLGAQIVRLNVEPWVSIYRAQKSRLQAERGGTAGIEACTEIEQRGGSAVLPHPGYGDAVDKQGYVAV